jgi:hypothetical protein
MAGSSDPFTKAGQLAASPVRQMTSLLPEAVHLQQIAETSAA